MSQFGELRTEVRRLRRDVDDLQKLPGGSGFIADQIQAALDGFDLEDARLNGNTFLEEVNWGAGNAVFSSGGEQHVKWNFVAGYIGFYGRDSDDRVGMYDWANSRNIWYYDSGTPLFAINQSAYMSTNLKIGGSAGAAGYNLHVYTNDISTAQQFVIEQDSTGDASLAFLLTGIKRWTIGIDNSRDDILSFGYNAVLGTNEILYLDTWGAYLTGSLQLTANIYLPDANTYLKEGGSNSVRIQTNSGYIDIGPQNTSWGHITTDRAQFYFNKGATFYGGGLVATSSGAQAPTINYLSFYDSGAALRGDIGINNASAWLRLNTNATSNVYTPRSFAAAGAISAGSSNFGSTGDIYATADVLAAGGVMAGAAVTSDPGTGQILYTADLRAYRNSTWYTLYGMFPLTTFTTIYSGVSRTSANNGTITVGGTGGVPDNVKGVFINGAILANNTSAYVYFGTPGATAQHMEVHFYSTGISTTFAGFVPCNSGGDISVIYSSGHTFTVYLRVSGYII